MARPHRLGLSAVRTEGAILPPSILQRIHREDPTLGGMTPEDFGLSGTRVREAASQAWNALQAPWRAFQAERARLAPAEAGTGMTRSRWLNQIAKAVDYGAIDPLRESLEVGDRSFPLSPSTTTYPSTGSAAIWTWTSARPESGAPRGCHRTDSSSSS